MSKKEYDVEVWSLLYYKVDRETGDPLCAEDGAVQTFIVPGEDCSYVAEGVDPDCLVELSG